MGVVFANQREAPAYFQADNIKDEKAWVPGLCCVTRNCHDHKN
jgi:hypothetical protein